VAPLGHRIILTAWLKAARLPARAVQSALHFVSNLPALDKPTAFPENDRVRLARPYSAMRVSVAAASLLRFVDATVQQSVSFIGGK
jgi:hypothetical protein